MINSEKIREHRLRQPLSKLARKADKARERANIYSQEELDYADAWARDTHAKLGWER